MFTHEIYASTLIDKRLLNSDDRTALVSTTDGVASFSKSSLPPEWVDSVEEIQYDISRIQHKMKELAMVHDKHLNRPTLDDTMDEEHSIEIMTQEITQ
ncbi:syntaxin-16-like, partial [Anneissia japonica]|uniref:syntaxin-16-like n=1 Tax=Anneissia japonica TaxID=1529436 RepID=UPI0014259047